MFLNSMFEQMNTNVDGEGPFGGSGAQKVWRSFLTNQYAQMYAKAGGVASPNTSMTNCSSCKA